MKTATIDLLKKDLLIVELPEETDMKDPIQILKNKGNHLVYSKHNGHIISRNKLPDGEWNLLGKVDEIKEEDALKLVQYLTRRDLTITPKNYLKGKDGRFEDITFTESLLSALESEIYWDVNPSSFDDNKDDPEIRREMRYRWELAQEKTFDKKRTLILVKN